MSRNIRFALCLLAFTTAVAFSGCTGSEKPLGSTETESTPTVQTQRETEPAETLTAEERELVELAAEALWAAHELPAREHFREKISYGANRNTNTYVSFDLLIGGYTTNEGYEVVINADGRVTAISGGYDNYRQYVEAATPKRVAAAEKVLDERVGNYEEHSEYYLSVDDEGYLCLYCEVIVQLDPPPFSEGGCGIDHEHKFFYERICQAGDAFTEPAEDDLRLWGYITYRETSTLMKVTLFDEYQGYETVYVDVSGLYTHCEIEWEIFFTFDTTREPEMLDGIPVFKATYAETYAPEVPKKPVIYLYPETATVCSVKLTLNGHLTCTYPAYRDGWTDFTAHPDGTLIFPDGKEYYCLYWEGMQNMDCDFTQGFCVKGEDTAAFLEWALAAQGLTPREANEFIIYWLPRMEGNTYNVIAFQTDAYTEGAVLEITPAPDSLLRVFMAYYPTEEAVEIEPQSFAGFERNGFTVVEWGGCAMGTP